MIGGKERSGKAGGFAGVHGTVGTVTSTLRAAMSARGGGTVQVSKHGLSVSVTCLLSGGENACRDYHGPCCQVQSLYIGMQRFANTQANHMVVKIGTIEI